MPPEILALVSAGALLAKSLNVPTLLDLR